MLEDAANPQVILIGTGSEVAPAVDAAKLLANEGIAARVVSFPSWRIFEEQSAEYKASVLPQGYSETCRRSRCHTGLVEVRGSRR